MREQPAQIQNVFIGPVELFVDVLCGPQQHDAHIKGWRWNFYLQDAKARAAMVREEGLKIIAAHRARADALRSELAQLAAE